MKEELITYSVWAENSPGVLVRLCSLFTRRKINIESLTVSVTEEEGISRFTIVVRLVSDIAKKIARQIERIIEVRQVAIATDNEVVHSEVALFRLKREERDYARTMAHSWGAKLIELDGSVILEKTGSEEVISSMYRSLEREKVVEFLRSGRIAIRSVAE